MLLLEDDFILGESIEEILFDLKGQELYLLCVLKR